MSFLVFIIHFSHLDKLKSPDNNQKNNWYNQASLVMPVLLEMGVSKIHESRFCYMFQMKLNRHLIYNTNAWGHEWKWQVILF